MAPPQCGRAARATRASSTCLHRAHLPPSTLDPVFSMFAHAQGFCLDLHTSAPQHLTHNTRQTTFKRPTATSVCTQGHAAPVCALAVSSASPLLASAEEGASALIRLWRLEDGACLSLLHGTLSADAAGGESWPGLYHSRHRAPSPPKHSASVVGVYGTVMDGCLQRAEVVAAPCASSATTLYTTRHRYWHSMGGNSQGLEGRCRAWGVRCTIVLHVHV